MFPLEKENMLKNLKDIRNQAAKVEQELTGSKFCTTCQKSKPISGGKMKGLKYPRWVCADCFKFTKG